MKNIVKVSKWTLIFLGSMLTLNTFADTVYCENNKQLRCLGFDEKVVSRNTLCLDPMKCDQEGFVCKSELNSINDEYEALNKKYNDLANTHNQLLDTYNKSTSAYEDAQRCVTVATTLEEAKSCF